jgi:hypothetical protein
MEYEMIVANLATYPPRSAELPRVIFNLAPQVDRLNIVLNNYTTLPEIDELPRHVRLILPPTDLKDTGKFYAPPARDDFVFFVDDDIVYPPNYVANSLSWLRKFGSDRFVVGFHGSIYRAIDDLNHRDIFNFATGLKKPIIVDQLGSGTLAMRGCNCPSFGFMAGSERFVDVRLAKWCYEKNLTMLCLPREPNSLVSVPFDETIHTSFTLHSPPHVVREVRAFALKRADVGKSPVFDESDTM